MRSIASWGIIEGSIVQASVVWAGWRAPSTRNRLRVPVLLSKPRRFTLTVRSWLPAAEEAFGSDPTTAWGIVRNRSPTVKAPTMAKSCGAKLITGTPTAAVPRISDPVISMVSGTSSAWATTSPCARAGIAPASVRSDTVPHRAASGDRALWRDVLKLIGSPHLEVMPAGMIVRPIGLEALLGSRAGQLPLFCGSGDQVRLGDF